MSEDAGVTEIVSSEEDARNSELDPHVSAGEIWAGYLAGAGVVLGFGALFYKPLLFGFFATLLLVFGSIGNEGGARISKIGLPIVAICVFAGMMIAIFLTERPVW